MKRTASTLRPLQPLSSTSSSTSTSSSSTSPSSSASSSSTDNNRPDEWQVAVTRKRSSSIEQWLQKTLHLDVFSPERKDKHRADKARRREKRKAFFRKIFGGSKKEKAATGTVGMSSERHLETSQSIPPHDEDEDLTFHLDDLYDTSINEIIQQYKSVEEEDAPECIEDNNNSDNDHAHADVERALSSPARPHDVELQIANVCRNDELGEYVQPPVTVPPEYAIRDRRGGALVAGSYVLFTSAAFKRRQRHLLYQMRSIPESTQVVPAQLWHSSTMNKTSSIRKMMMKHSRSTRTGCEHRKMKHREASSCSSSCLVDFSNPAVGETPRRVRSGLLTIVHLVIRLLSI